MDLKHSDSNIGRKARIFYIDDTIASSGEYIELYIKNSAIEGNISNINIRIVNKAMT